MARYLNFFYVSFSYWIFILLSDLHSHQIPGYLSRVRPVKKVSKNVLGLHYRKLVECKACLATMFVFLYEIVDTNRNV